MKQFILALLFISVLHGQGYYYSKAAVGGCSLSVVSSCGNTANEGGILANADAVAWVGTEIIPSTTYSIDEASIYIKSIVGNVDTIDYVCEVYTIQANGYDLDTKVGSTSAVKTGLTANAWNNFTFASTITINTTPTYGYCIIFRRNDWHYNASHYANLSYGTTDWTTLEAATYLEGYKTLLASGSHATIEYTIRWSDCD